MHAAAGAARSVRRSLLPSIYQSIRLELSQIEGDLVLRGVYLDVLSQTYLTSPREEAVLPVRAGRAAPLRRSG